MAQVISVSANTAAYVADNLRILNRPQKTTSVKEAIEELARRRAEDQGIQSSPALATAVKPAALALFFMNLNLSRQPHTSLREVKEAYDEQKKEEEAQD